LWTGDLSANGFPCLSMQDIPGKWTTHPARNISYQLAYGPLPRRALIAVTCGEPLCVHPDHLSNRSIKRTITI
jgi:hypothetical protein